MSDSTQIDEDEIFLNQNSVKLVDVDEMNFNDSECQIKMSI